MAPHGPPPYVASSLAGVQALSSKPGCSQPCVSVLLDFHALLVESVVAPALIFAMKPSGVALLLASRRFLTRTAIVFAPLWSWR